MPSRRKPYSSDFPLHIVARCSNKEWFQIPLNQVWETYSNHLFYLKHWFNFKIHSFVLMPNHFHLICEAPEGNLAIAMNYFMRETSRELGKRSGRINQIYGRPYFASTLKTNHYFLNAYKYVYRNPIEARLCTTAEAYPFSTLHSTLGLAQHTIPTHVDENLFQDTKKHLRWINTAYESQDLKQSIKAALNHREFKFSRDRKGRPHKLESTLI